MRKAAVAISLAATALAGCSGDLTIKSDLGEKTIIKKSAVESRTFDKAYAEKMLDGDSLYFWQGAYDECLSKYRPSICDPAQGKELEKEKKRLNAMKAFAAKDMKMQLLKYRPIFVDLNGRKSAPSTPTYLACVPKSFNAEEIDIAIQAAKEVGYRLAVDTDTEAEYQTRLKICQKFGSS